MLVDKPPMTFNMQELLAKKELPQKHPPKQKLSHDDLEKLLKEDPKKAEQKISTTQTSRSEDDFDAVGSTLQIKDF
jgi:hypothetical protein